MWDSRRIQKIPGTMPRMREGLTMIRIDLAKELLALPQSIKEAQDKIIALSDKYESCRVALENIHSLMLGEISGIRGHDGKPVYSNETMREAEFIKRSETHMDVQFAKKSEQESRTALNNARNDLELLNNKMKVRLAVTRLLSSGVDEE